MSAGESAAERARRQREKADRLQRSADLWERGAQGEQQTASVLATLPPEEWTVIHDVRWPGRRYANVDHVVIGPPGVFMIDSKNWSGSITTRDDVLRQNGYSREPTVAAAAEAGLALTALAGVPAHPVLCFVREEPLTGWARDVMVCSTANVLHMLTTRPPILDAAQREMIALQLDASLRAATEPAPRRTRSVPRARATRSARARSARRTTSKSKRGSDVKAVLVLAVLVLFPRPGHSRGAHFWTHRLARTGSAGHVALAFRKMPGQNQASVDLRCASRHHVGRARLTCVVACEEFG